jgi:hypothetical protein
MNSIVKNEQKMEWLGSCINGQSPLEEKVPWEQLFISIFRILLLFFSQRKKEKKCEEK